MAALLVACMPASAADVAKGAAEPMIRVGNRALGARDFDEQLQLIMRQRYYHGQVPPEALESLRSEARASLIDRTLLLEEARRRGIAADPGSTDAALARMDARYGSTPAWREQRERVRARIAGDAALAALDEQVRRGVTEPSDADLAAFYAARPDLFTEPARVHVAVILLGVEASAPKAKWDAARAEGAEVAAQLRRGADFAAMARLRSTDNSASQGGDMGYLHHGMLPTLAEDALDRLAPGGISDPLTLLEGVTIFKLVSRQDARLVPFDAVRARARELWRREAAERRSRELLAALRAATPVTVSLERNDTRP